MRTTAPIALLGLGFIVACPAGDAQSGGDHAPAAKTAPTGQPKAAPASQPASAPSAAAGVAGEPIGGVITMAKGMTAKPTDVLFIMARES